MSSQAAGASTEKPLKGYEATLGAISTLEIEVTAERIEGARLSPGVDENTKANYKLNVSVSEVRRRPGSMGLAFTLELSAAPQVAKMTVSGNAKVTGVEDEIRLATAPRQGKAPPKLVEMLYDKLYGLLYILAGSLNVPYPMPSLVKENKQSS